MVPNLTITPPEIKEGETVIIICSVYQELLTSSGSFEWRLKGKVLMNGQRITIETKYDVCTGLHHSQVTLKESSWRDSGEICVTYLTTCIKSVYFS